MLRILHLSDVHLGSGAEGALSDYKIELVPLAERQQRRQRLEEALAQLATYLGGEQLDAVIVTGDVSYLGHDDGFEQLAPLLRRLGPALPSEDRILVVPGNHDVTWGTTPSSPDRYRNFVAGIREAGYRTPLLEGIDIDPSTGDDLATPSHDPIIVLDTALVVGINSSNYCGSDEELKWVTEDDLRRLADASRDSSNSWKARVAKELARLRRHDVCRISQGQLQALRNRLHSVPSSSVWRIRIAGLHHHLLPVDDSEEIKTFESMTNLGQFRNFLTSRDIRLVLHGHKHTPAVYYDLPSNIRKIGSDLRLPSPPVLVSSAATIWNPGDPECCRLIEVDDGLPGIRQISIRQVPNVATGGSLLALKELASATYLESYLPSRVAIFEGATAEDVYGQLCQAFPDPESTLDTVICRIKNGQSGRRLPDAYSAPVVLEERQAWFDETVKWWQDDTVQLLPPQFNHGTRIKNFGGEGINQLESVIAELETRPTTSRGIIILFEPQSRRPSSYRPQPAFALLQLIIRNGNLDCIGYFRKQQMRSWWPINVGELAHLQQRVCAPLNLRAGEIVTISAQALGGTDRARVIVPWVDRAAEYEEERLWSMVLALFMDDAGAQSRALADWKRVFADWCPAADSSREANGVPIALMGLEVMTTAAKLCVSLFPDEQAEELERELSQLHQRNRSYWTEDFEAESADRRQTLYDNWAREVRAIIERINRFWQQRLEPTVS